MNWKEALEIVVNQTGVERYRLLCSDDSPAPGGPQAYRDLMISMATGTPAPPSRTYRDLQRTKQCPYRSADLACGCSGIRCALRFSLGGSRQIVSPRECIECVRTHGL